jgi:hypothetical protein
MNLLPRVIDKMKIRLTPFLCCDRIVFDGLSRREIIGWIVCLALAVGLALFGGAYLVASSLTSADVSNVLKPDGAKRSQQQTP